MDLLAGLKKIVSDWSVTHTKKWKDKQINTEKTQYHQTSSVGIECYGDNKL